ncbi:NAD(P)H-binding protein [Isoptericola halotolerans]|uniref:NmrA family NAD(P)-binding protein n=1 Tax=Isoptericola halotolerans TaxID=300560 RepID=UPI00388E7A4C
MRIAVTGSTGRLGNQVVGLLARSSASSPHEVLALARRPSVVPAVHASDTVTAVHADYDDLGSLESALYGVDALVFVSSDGDAARMMIHHENVVRAADTCGVGHVVYLSGVDVDPASPFCYAFTNGYTERLLARTRCGYSFARASLFTEFFASFLRPALSSGELRVPAGSGRVAIVSRSDVGRALAALAVLPPSGRHHDLTGPTALSLDDMAEVLTEVAGRSVSYADVSPEVHVEELARLGEQPWWIYAYSTMFASVREDRWSTVSDEVLRLTGRVPTSVADMAGRFA